MTESFSKKLMGNGNLFDQWIRNTAGHGVTSKKPERKNFGSKKKYLGGGTMVKDRPPLKSVVSPHVLVEARFRGVGEVCADGGRSG
jgi:hypothetical protein